MLQLLIHQASVCLSLDYAGKQYRSKKPELQLTNDTGMQTESKIDFTEKPDSYLALGVSVLQRGPQGCQWEADHPNHCSRSIF